MGPYDYTIHAQNPTDALTQGYQLGFGVNQLQQAQEAKQAQEQAQAQLNADLAAASTDISKIPALMVRYPQLADKLKSANDAANAEQSRASLDFGGQVLAALQSKRPDIAAGILRDRATALRNSGDERGAQLHEAMAQSAETAPDVLKQATALRIAAIPGGDKVIEGIAKLGVEQRAQEQAPADLKKKQADADAAAVAAKFAESKAIADLNLTQQQAAHLAADTEIQRANTRIAALNAQTNQANSETQRKELELKLQDAQQKRDDLARTKVAEVRQGAAVLDNLLNTVEQLKKHPALDAVVGPLAGKDLYPHTAIGMTTFGQVGLVPDADQRSDAIALIDQLQSQASLGQLQSLKQASANGSSGFGALSEKELSVIENGIQSLRRTQSPEQFRAKLDEMSRLMLKNRDILAQKYGVDAGKPDTPAAPGARPPLSAFGGG